MRSDVLKNIRQYKWKSMYFKYISSYLGLAILAYAGVIIIFISYFMPKMNEMFTQKAVHTCQTNAVLLDEKFSEIYSTMVSLITDNDVYNVIECTDLERPAFKILQSVQSVAEFIAQKKNEDNHITNIAIYNSKCEYVLNPSSSGPMEKLAESAWTKCLKNFENLEMFFLFYENAHYYICQKLHTGMVIIEIDNIFDTVLVEGQFYVLETRNNVWVYRSDPAQVSLQIQKQEQEVQSYLKNDEIHVQIEGDYWFRYLFTVPAFNIFSDNVFWNIVIWLGLFLLFFIVILSVFQTNRSYRHITNILALCDTDESLSHDEWVTISTHLINLTNEKTLIEEELLDKVNQIKKYQNIALQTQLTPHFLFNTLHMINLSIQNTIHGDCQGTRMITQLSAFLRITLDTQKNIVALETELNHAESYLALEQMKYEDWLNVSCQIDPECLNVQIPKLILQPILENSILHGMKDNMPLTITIRITRNQRNVVVAITDDGSGMNEDQLQKLRERMGQFPETQHIGLSNVIKRVQLYYGEDFRYEIQSEVDRGTAVILHIPQILSVDKGVHGN